MKLQYIIAPLITLGIIAVSANYVQVYYLLHSLKTPGGIVKILKQEQLEARIPPNRGIPTNRESGSSRQLKWEN
ncbi:hypothetical protein WA1_17405 [Scytonema hofmannii PCC 7110]|uniref:Uncharacterized protein n=1 Tax=Scytonema hofmannii PCC 7110 TaxID=128403 RepID=A0A139XB10_9CYAN|nr:hypothetical protein [Scytonema hofmannii]KYC41802.1 hypothetical protein WA1_17405 [Scytonema hofmannii PCC 7110]